MAKFVRTIFAVGDSGKKYEVHEYVDQIDVTTKDSDGREYIDGMRSLRLNDGRRLNYLNDGTFEIVGGEQVKVTS